nr:uncharacterized protein LOC110382225 [Helicoverpa armigera]
MREIPECLNRRYLMLDKLIKDLSSNLPPPGSVDESASCDNNQVGIKMMCDFWNILQDDPECNLTQEVQQRLCGEADCSGMYGPARVDCFRASKDQDSNKGKELPVNRVTRIRVEKDPKSPNRHGCCANSTDGDKLPLSQVLCNLKEAASYDKKCNIRVGELMTAQAELKEQIQILEEREKQGGELLKQADAMWSCMEESYKKKVAESQDRYAVLTKELKEIEQSANKWRKNKKDLEFQMQNITQCNEDIKEKIKQKKNDLKIMDLEIIDFKNRIESNDKDLYKAKNSYKAKKEASDARIATIASEMAQVEKKLAVEYKHKADKEQEGVQYVKEAREDLQKICRVLLQKKLENEDLQAEKEALIQDIDLLKQTCDNCKEKCANKEKSIEEEIKKVEADLIEFRKKCIKCHECTDTIDVRKFCTDCPRCLAERDCLYEGDHCSLDHSMDCVCMSVKQKFLDNVFDNMYTVLERQSKTCPGKAVADCVLNCLKRSRNGKLNEETRKVLQEFILSTVKKNLNLTIVGGAVKTRCEMDPETYKQLMVCLKEVAVTKPVKEDKGTGSRKEPCRRWGGPSECHCPKGPKACICTKKALPPPTDPVSCGPQPADEKESPSKICPVREPLACSLDCGMLGLPGASDLKREPCAGQSCAFSKNSKNMRAAQCMLGTEALASIHHHPTPPLVPNLLATDKKAACTCGGKAVKPCPCHRDAKHLKAEVKDECNKGTCANFRKPSTNRPEDVYEQVGISRQRQGRSPQANAKKRAGQNVAKDQFKIAINNENGKAKNQFTKLTKTKSGRVAMELDEDIIELLEQKSKYDSYLYISVRKTDSGNLLLYFDTKGNDVDNTQRVTVRQTPSGTRLLDIHKTMMNMLRETLSNRVPNSSISKSIKLSVSSTREDSPTKVPKLSDEYLKKIGNETQSLKNNIMPSQDMKDKIEGKEDIRCPCPAGSPVSVCSKVKSDTNSPIKDGSNPLTIVDKENLKCKNTGKCPKAMPDSVCCKLKDDTNCPSDLVEPKDISGPSPSIKDKYFPIKPNKKADNSCTCPKGSPDRSCCKQTNLPQKGIRRATDTVLPQSHKEDKNMCSCPKSIPLPVCSKQSKVIPSTEKHIKSKLITKAEEVTSNRKSDISGSEVREDESDFISELTYLYKEGNANIFVKVRGKNGIMRILSTVVTKTESGTIAFYGGDISSLKNTEYDGTDLPVLLSKTASGTLFINLESTDEKVNAMLRKTPSGGILLIPKTCKECKRHSSEELFKVVVTGVTTSPVELPAVLKMTLSENYIILLDKEFEKHCKEVFDELVGLKTECFVDLHRTDSGDYIIELDTEGNAPTDKNNALLIKSSSGNLKVLVHGPVFEALLPDLSSKSSASSAKAFGQIINKLPASSREIHRENLRKSKRLDRKASSDTQIYEKIKVQLQENKQLLSEPSAILKRTDSGQYSIVLNKESKKAFINNLQHYLTTNSEGLIPIRRSNSGQIIISLNNNNEGKGNFGSLKITSSGNIYILVDEDIIKDMSKDSKDILDKTGSKRPRNIADLIATVSKAVATTCHAKPDDCDCDTTKCICDELQLETIDWSQENPAKFVSPILKKNIVESVDRRHPIPRDEPPHIVIKPNCDCGALPNSKFGSTEQCFIVVDSVCPFHKDRYKAVSNELLEISGLCKTHEKNNDNEILELEANHDIPSKGEQREVWDSLNYLPPQLPSFLKDVCYR